MGSLFDREFFVENLMVLGRSALDPEECRYQNDNQGQGVDEEIKADSRPLVVGFGHSLSLERSPFTSTAKS
jgi:hypothetical protein